MIFQGFHKKEFYQHFSEPLACFKYLSDMKWKDGYRCIKCGHEHYMPGKRPCSRRCKSCKYDESVTSHTLFHKLKFPIEKAFELLFMISATKKGVSTNELSEEVGVGYEACLGFRRKAQRAMESSRKYPLKGKVEVDETAIGGYDPESQGRAKGDKKLVSIALEITPNGEFGRAYAQKIEDYSADELEKIFRAHIDKDAQVRTDKWTGYLPIKETYSKLTQEPSDKGNNFKELHLHIMNLKNWIRGFHHHVSEEYVQRYLDEFHFRFNRRAFRNSRFHKLIERMIDIGPILHSQLMVKAT